MAFLSKLLQAVLASALSKVLQRLGSVALNAVYELSAKVSLKIKNWWSKKKIDDAGDKLKQDLGKAADDVKAQEDAADDFFDSNRG